MSQKIKKILIILGLILLFVFIALLIYSLISKKRALAPPAPGPEEIPTEEGIAPAPPERLIALTDETVLGAGLSTDKITYLAWDGTINQINFDGGAKTKLGAVSAERLGQVTFSPDAQKLVFAQGLAAGGTRLLRFDTSTKKLQALAPNADSIAFSPNSQKLATGLQESDGHRLVLSELTGQAAQNLITTKIPDLVLAWPQENSLILKTRPSGLAHGLVYALDLRTKKLQRVLGNVYGLTLVFSPAADKILYSETSLNGLNLQLKVLDLQKNTEQNLNMFSLPEKCVWSQDNRTIFCAIINAPGNFVMPDDYYKRKLPAESETLVKINLDTGQTQEIISAGVDAASMFLAPDEEFLFFINKIDGRLYRLTL